MKSIMPQEIEVWYILPALRRELAKMLVSEHNLNQKEAAGILKITESAVSQYLKSKRAKGIEFSESILTEIKNSAKKLVKNKACLMGEMQRLCKCTREGEILCRIHRHYDATVPNSCGACLKTSPGEKNVKNIS